MAGFEFAALKPAAAELAEIEVERRRARYGAKYGTQSARPELKRESERDTVIIITSWCEQFIFLLARRSAWPPW